MIVAFRSAKVASVIATFAEQKATMFCIYQNKFTTYPRKFRVFASFAERKATLEKSLVFAICQYPGLGNRVLAIGIREQRWLAFAVQHLNARRKFMRAVEHIIVGNNLTGMVAAIRPILVTRLALTPRSTSL